jgi:hypothetical protein
VQANSVYYKASIKTNKTQKEYKYTETKHYTDKAKKKLQKKQYTRTIEAKTLHPEKT